MRNLKNTVMNLCIHSQVFADTENLLAYYMKFVLNVNSVIWAWSAHKMKDKSGSIKADNKKPHVK